MKALGEFVTSSVEKIGDSMRDAAMTLNDLDRSPFLYLDVSPYNEISIS
jgi:hypothetical protein